MRLWKRASDALKDQSSLWQASLRRRTALRNPDIEKAVIRATSHHDSSPSDQRNVERVREWLRLSPSNLKPILRSLSARIEKTHSWPVALKGLLLTHALLNCPAPAPALRAIGRLPFDLSSFRSNSAPFDAFVRAYFAFLDQKSATMFQLSAEEEKYREGFAMRHELLLLQKLQALLDLLVGIKPAPCAAFAPLILDVMDAVVVEIYDVYGRICRGIATVLLNIYSAGKAEAATALRVVHKATQQGDDLAYFFEFCQEIRVANAAEFPVIDRIPEEGIRELEQIIEGLTNPSNVVTEGEEFKTVITEEWEKFDEDSEVGPLPATCARQQGSRNGEAPDLITFF
ncbi:putative clathrin assembly protein At1g25240 [Salvia miltiorrhiza]|uniref:putative clathrin assembly protein At1g25240 n=1 Tax=Salvia miltiorrhiza TaxID=226208 RepID=UPI0025ABBA6F|nr:putative clathrin assembly protein At1g25240 [Salvia miltiorrhiza]